MGEDDLGHRAAVITLSFNIGAGRAGDGILYRTAIVECIPDGGAWLFQDHDENGLCRSLNRSVLQCGRNVCTSHEDFYLGSGGGFMIPRK